MFASCRLQGTLKLLKVKGNFHIALGQNARHPMNPNGRHVHQFSFEEMKHYNTSHQIDELSFGAHFPGLVNPLNAHEGNLNSGTCYRLLSLLKFSLVFFPTAPAVVAV
jgi:hypothetical protein